MAPVTALSARAAYRTRQVFHALHPRIAHGALARASVLLTPAEARLFFAMEKRDQRHALEVLSRLEARGVTDSALLKAALLHDCGKGAVPVWLRIAKVLSPGWVASAGTKDSTGWRGSAYRLTHHAEIGARLAAEAGSNETTIQLIRGQVQPEHHERLTLLLEADDAS